MDILHRLRDLYDKILGYLIAGWEPRLTEARRLAASKGTITANRILKNDLAYLLSKDESLNLRSWLQEKCHTYASLRERHIERALHAHATAAAPVVQSIETSSQFLHNVSPLSEAMVLERKFVSAAQTWAKSRNIPLSKDQTVSEIELRNAIFAGEILADLINCTVIALSSDLVVKVVGCESLKYLESLDYIIEHTTNLPAPKTLGLLTAEGRGYLFMERASGVELSTIWTSLDTNQKLSIKTQLEKSFTELRRIPRPENAAFGTGHPAYCLDLRRYLRKADGPVYHESEFNCFLTSTDGRRENPLLEMVGSFLVENHDIVMTHSDLHPRNIMVSKQDDETITVESILDWEYCGWYPAYWEYVKALNTVSQKEGTSDWYKYLPTSAIGVWGGEFAINHFIDKWR